MTLIEQGFSFGFLTRLMRYSRNCIIQSDSTL
jgi:hypothetical protein